MWWKILLCVLGAIVLLMILLLALNIHIELLYTDSLNVYIKLFGIRIDVKKLFSSFLKSKKGKTADESRKDKPEENKGKKKSGEESSEEKKKNILKRAFSRTGSGGLTDVIIDIISFISKLGTSVKKHLCINRCDFIYTVTGSDSARTAEKYGIICAAAYETYAILSNLICFRNFRTAIKPDFLGKKSKGSIYIDISYRVFWIVVLGLKAVLGYIKINTGVSKTPQSENNNFKSLAAARQPNK